MTIVKRCAAACRLARAPLWGALIAAAVVPAAHAQTPPTAMTLHFNLPDPREFADGAKWDALKPRVPGEPASATRIYFTYVLTDGRWQPADMSVDEFVHPEKVRTFTDMGGELPHFPPAEKWPGIWAAPDGTLYFPFPDKGWTQVPLGTRINTFHGPVTLSKRITPAEARQLLMFTLRQENGAVYQIRPLYLGLASDTPAAAAAASATPTPTPTPSGTKPPFPPLTDLAHPKVVDFGAVLKNPDRYRTMAHLPEGARTVEEAHILAGDRGWWAQYKLAVVRGRWDILKQGPIGFAVLVLAGIMAIDVVGRLLLALRARA